MKRDISREVLDQTRAVEKKLMDVEQGLLTLQQVVSALDGSLSLLSPLKTQVEMTQVLITSLQTQLTELAIDVKAIKGKIIV